MTNSIRETPKHLPLNFGKGSYSAATIGCYLVCKESLQMTTTAVDKVISSLQQQNDNKPITVVDYGCADGGTDMDLWISVIKRFQKADKPIIHIWEDQRTNDWNSLFSYTQGYLQTTTSTANNATTATATTTTSTYSDLENVYVMASAVSFHHPTKLVSPPGTVCLGYSSTAMHWLSKLPQAAVTNKIHTCLIPKTDSALAMFKKQAALDWYNILDKRQSELTVGGHLVVVMLGTCDQTGEFLGRTLLDGVECMFTTLDSIWKGLVSNEDYLNTSFCNYYRTRQEIIDGIDQFPNLETVEFETKSVQCPLYQMFKNSDITVDEYSLQLVATVKTWSYSTFLDGLTSGTVEEMKLVVDSLFDHYREIIIKNPDKHRMDYVHHYFSLRKNTKI